MPLMPTPEDEKKKKKMAGYGGLPVTGPSETMMQNAAKSGLQLKPGMPQVFIKNRRRQNEWVKA